MITNVIVCAVAVVLGGIVVPFALCSIFDRKGWFK